MQIQTVEIDTCRLLYRSRSQYRQNYRERYQYVEETLEKHKTAEIKVLEEHIEVAKELQLL